MTYIDISPLISDTIGVWPGDRAYQRQITGNWDGILVSNIQTTVHLGAHADAPNHYDPRGCGIAERSLHYYMGHCQLIQVPLGPGQRIYPKDLPAVLAQRILFATGTFPDPDNWNEDFGALSPELVHFLADAGVILVGIDTPSVDPQNSSALESHHAICARDMAILEGLRLEVVPAGQYNLVALPLKLKDADASPVRAILLPYSPGQDPFNQTV